MKYDYTLKTMLVSPCIQLVPKNKTYMVEIRYYLEDSFHGKDVKILWDEYSDNLITLGIELNLNTHVNYGEKMDEAIELLSAHCYDYDYDIRINGEIVRSSHEDSCS